MKSRTTVVPVLVGLLIVAIGAARPGAHPASGERAQEDAVLAALDAELARSSAGFARHTERAPYFLGYAVWDRQEEILTAGAGSVLVDRGVRQRLLDVDVRVGDYRLDNTRRLQGRGAPPPAPGGAALIPLGDDVPALRAAIWQRTERDYRAALERLAQVEANRAAMAAASDTSGDFSREEPHVLIEQPPPALELERDAWKERLRRVSARFTAHADIHNAVVMLRATRDVRYLVNSEGTRVRTGERRLRLTLVADTRTADGTDLNLSRAFEASAPEGLPAEAALLAAADTMIGELAALRAAPEVEPYSGPAILTGRASAVFFHEIFGHRIEGHRQKDESFAQTFTSRLGEQVLPAFLSVADDPTLRAFEGVELAGHYRVDDEGVPARSVTLVDAGVLSGFLMSRSPIAAAARSNGHGRRQPGLNAVARQGNLIVTSTQAVSPDELRARLIEEIRRQGKPYGYRFEEIQGGFTATARITPQSFKILPLKVYRVYPDGRPDELVRGADVVGTPLTVFGKILATDDRPEVFNGVCGAESGQVAVSAVSPGVLIQELEVEKRAKSLERPPILAVPPSDDPGGARGAGDDDVVFRALSHELSRSLDSLRLDGLAAPHYIAYRVEDGVELLVDATFGALLNRNLLRTRRLEADVRAGTPQLDNTNFVGPGVPGALGWVEIGFEDSYAAIRRFAWRITDGRYKAAAERLARKQAALEGRPPLEAPSFVPDSARTVIEPAVALTIEPGPWSDLAQRVSAVFREYEAIEDARARVQVRAVNRYLVASDGTRSRTPETTFAVHVSAVARGPGGPIRDYRLFVSASQAGLPEPDVVLAGARALAEDLTARAQAATIENYTGPVLLEGTAAPQFFHALLGRHLGGTPGPVVGGRGAAPPRRLEALFGQRVLPAGFTVVDDATRAEVAGVPLIGRYAIDEEGVPPRAVRLVEDGMLRAYLFSRIPARAEDRSTGHGRDSSSGEVRPIIGNLIVEAAGGVAPARLRQELLASAQERGLEYAVIVRGLEDLGMLPPRGAQRPARSELPPPVAVYKLLPDGREEPVRDVDFGEVTIRALRDITAAGGTPVVYNFLQFGGSNYLRWGTTPIGIAAPAVLVSELPLLKSESSTQPPVLPRPSFAGG